MMLKCSSKSLAFKFLKDISRNVLSTSIDVDRMLTNGNWMKCDNHDTLLDIQSNSIYIKLRLGQVGLIF